MNLLNQDIKLLAKRQLKKNLSSIISISSVFLAAYLLLGFLTRYLVTISNNYGALIVNLLITTILSFFLNILLVGYIHFLLHCITQKEAGYPDLLYGFKACADKVIAITFLSGILTYIWLVPSIVFLVLYYITGYQQELFVALFMLFLIIGLCISCFFALSLSQSLFLIADNSSITVFHAIKSSRHMMKGQKANLLYLFLSFFGLFILGIFTCYIGFFIIFPYFYLSRAYYYLNITQQLTRDNLLS